MIRPLAVEDAEELTKLLVVNRRSDAPFVPERTGADILAVDDQRRHIRAAAHFYAILDEGELAGTIMLSNVVRAPLQSASLGDWVDDGRHNRGHATHAASATTDSSYRARVVVLFGGTAQRGWLRAQIPFPILAAPHTSPRGLASRPRGRDLIRSALRVALTEAAARPPYRRVCDPSRGEG